MNSRISLWIAVAGLTITCVACAKKDEEASNPPSATPTTESPANPAPTSPSATGGAFAKVEAVFAANCVKCHGGAAPKGGIDLSTYASVMKGGEDGAVVVAGNPDQSKIVMALKGAPGVKKMPMMAAPLSDADIATISNWIKDGAKEN